MVGPLVRPGRLRIRGLSTRGRGFAPRLPRRSPARGRGDGFGGEVAGGFVNPRRRRGGWEGLRRRDGWGACTAGPAVGDARHTSGTGARPSGMKKASGSLFPRPGAGRSGPARDAGRRAYTRRPLRPCRTRTARTYADRTRPPVASEDPRRWHAPRPRHRARHGPARGLAARPRAGVLRSPRHPATAPRRRMPMAADSPLSVPRTAPRTVSHAGRLVQDLPPFPSRAALRALTDRELPSTDGRPLPESMYQHPTIHYTVSALARWFKTRRPGTCVAGELMLYSEGRVQRDGRVRAKTVVPDVMVAFAVGGAQAPLLRAVARGQGAGVRAGGGLGVDVAARPRREARGVCGAGGEGVLPLRPAGAVARAAGAGLGAGAGAVPAAAGGAARGRAVGGAQPGAGSVGVGEGGREGSFAGATRTRGGTSRTTTRFTTAGTRRPKPGAWRSRGPRRKPKPDIGKPPPGGRQRFGPRRKPRPAPTQRRAFEAQVAELRARLRELEGGRPGGGQ